MAKEAVPKVAGMPPAHVAVDCALAGVPVVYLTPTVVSNTQASHTVCPEFIDIGLKTDIVCHPAEEFTVVAGVTPRRVAGEAEALE